VRVLNKEGFRSIIASLTGLSDGATVWDLDPQPFVSPNDRAKVVLQLFSLTSLGVDEHRMAYGPPGYPANAMVTTEIGNRTLKITMRAEAFDATAEASEILDLIRTGVRADAVVAQLNAINIALVETGPATFVSYQVDERMVNAAIADFTFAGIAQQTSAIAIDGTPALGGYISTVNTNNAVPGTLT
jgi:hypothetical protein